MTTPERRFITDLYDVGPVTFPAYTETSVDVRAAGRRLPDACALWPAGVPEDVRRHFLALERRAKGRRLPRRSTRADDCTIACAECCAGDCDNCSHSGCDCDPAQERSLLLLRARAHISAS